MPQAELWCKYNTNSTDKNNFDSVRVDEADKSNNSDQRIHMDYGNNTFLHPSPWEDPDVVSAILYYDDSQEVGGNTAIVPKTSKTEKFYQPPYVKQIGYGNFLPYINNRTNCENYFKKTDAQVYNFRQKIYQHEIKPEFKTGTILLYRHDIWHRGTPIKFGKSRRVHNLVYRRADREHILQWNIGFGWNNYYGEMEKVITEASPLGRSVIYFPLPGDQYWEKDEHIEYMQARYPGIDMQPYVNQQKSKKMKLRP